MIILIILAVIIFVIPFISGLCGNTKIMRLYGIKENELNPGIALDDLEDLEDITNEEKITLLDEVIIKYNNLDRLLIEQYNNETDEKKKAAILKQQITNTEKWVKALEKREKLD